MSMTPLRITTNLHPLSLDWEAGCELITEMVCRHHPSLSLSSKTPNLMSWASSRLQRGELVFTRRIGAIVLWLESLWFLAFGWVLIAIEELLYWEDGTVAVVRTVVWNVALSIAA